MLTPTGGSEVKASACNAGDLGLTPGSGRSSGEGNGNLLQSCCLENPMDRGAWLATVHGVARVGHNLATKEREIYYMQLSGCEIISVIYTNKIIKL